MKTVEKSGADIRRIDDLLRVAQDYDAIVLSEWFDPQISVRQALDRLSKLARPGQFEDPGSGSGTETSGKSTEAPRPKNGLPDVKTAAMQRRAEAAETQAPWEEEPPEPVAEVDVVPGDADESPIVGAKDPDGQPIPEKAKVHFENVPVIEDWCNRLKSLADELTPLRKGPGGRCIPDLVIQDDCRGLSNRVWAERPTHVCPNCRGAKPCAVCENQGWVPEHVVKEI
jgi:hypothetical protein